MTKVFNSYAEFLKRDDKSINGVSADFAKENKDYEAGNATNEGCWNCSRCSGCYGCSGCYDCSRCYGCSGCSGCYDCSRCSGCYGCSGCYDKKRIDDAGLPKIPIIENIHKRVLDAIQDNGNKLDMSTWHTCETTHCRAGWVIHLAGKEGYELEKETSALFAAMQIYHKSSTVPVSPVRFFDLDKKAIEDIKRCAEEETKNLIP